MARRCLICGNFNPCSSHSDDEQDDELRRNIRAIREIESRGDAHYCPNYDNTTFAARDAAGAALKGSSHE